MNVFDEKRSRICFSGEKAFIKISIFNKYKCKYKAKDFFFKLYSLNSPHIKQLKEIKTNRMFNFFN